MSVSSIHFFTLFQFSAFTLPRCRTRHVLSSSFVFAEASVLPPEPFSTRCLWFWRTTLEANGKQLVWNQCSPDGGDQLSQQVTSGCSEVTDGPNRSDHNQHPGLSALGRSSGSVLRLQVAMVTAAPQADAELSSISMTTASRASTMTVHNEVGGALLKGVFDWPAGYVAI